MKTHPRIIQGGMGIAVSAWQLAKAVSLAGELGVISGTAIDSVLARRLQDGDLDGDMRRALSNFPDQIVAKEILRRFYIEGGKEATRAYLDVPKLIVKPTEFALHMLVASTFVEVWLAKEGHDGVVGMNILEKIQLAIPAQLFGAMLAGVDYVLIGAGIPAQIPRVLNELSTGKSLSMKIDVDDTTDKYIINFDPGCIDNIEYPIKRPDFIAIVSSHALVAYLNKDEETKPDGFVIEYHVAGGHNAPPRAKDSTDANGEAIYTDADTPKLEKVIASGSPFWLAGGFATPQKLEEAIALGANGIQVGSIFALCDESGFTKEIRSEILASLTSGEIHIRTDASASPTGFPFKVIDIKNSLSESESFDGRIRNCDLGYLRTPFRRASGGIGYRCPAEPLSNYTFKNGEAGDAKEAKCLCNALMADIGMGQIRSDGRTELPLVTIGSDLEGLNNLAMRYRHGWSAVQALDYLKMA